MERARETGCAIILPVDAIVASELKAGAAHHAYGIDAIPSDGMILDIGSQSIERVNAAINDAATLVWNGPLGAFEIAPFDQGTVAAARHAAERGGRRHGGGPQPRRGRWRLHLCFDRGGSLPRMARRQGAAGG
jgi:3-phosphoglycerate kinase